MIKLISGYDLIAIALLQHWYFFAKCMLLCVIMSVRNRHSNGQSCEMAVIHEKTGGVGIIKWGAIYNVAISMTVP